MNINIPWEDAPEWAEWAAMDMDGEWWWYENEPETDSSVEDGWFGDGLLQQMLYSTPWHKSITQRPSDK